MPPNHVQLLKLIWHPDDYADGKVKPTAFSSRDLSGELGNHVSVDRKDKAIRGTMEATAQSQASKANGINIFRQAALIGSMQCGLVREILFQGLPALSVMPIPVDGNEAHCGIFNISGDKSRAYMTEVRGKLAMLATPAQSLDEAYQD